MQLGTPSPPGETLSPLDSRYCTDSAGIRYYCNERALVRYRLELECKYLIRLSETLGFELSDETTGQILDCLRGVWVDDTINRVFELERETQHDVKAVELALREWIKKQLPPPEAEKLSPFIHFGLTSQDVTGIAIWKQLIGARDLLIQEAKLLGRTLLERFGEPLINTPLLARTHGQAATPTTMGIQMIVFVERLVKAIQRITSIEPSTKFGGATGGFNAHSLVFPTIDWPSWADKFLQDEFGVERQKFTTQIDQYDTMCSLFDAIKGMNVILLDLCRDVWQYVSMGYFRQSTGTSSIVGSSTMPHKVNPIRFENAEGNLDLANALLEFLSRKLPVSRLQRDLTDSTVTRNIGVALGHTMIALKSVNKGLLGLQADEDIMRHDLENSWGVVTEGLQTILRVAGDSDAYERLKHFSRGNKNIDEDTVGQFVTQLLPNVADVRLKQLMVNLTPLNYTPSSAEQQTGFALMLYDFDE